MGTRVRHTPVVLGEDHQVKECQCTCVCACMHVHVAWYSGANHPEKFRKPPEFSAKSGLFLSCNLLMNGCSSQSVDINIW